MTLDLENINVILATDCGSTTTKAILIEKVDGEYRQTYRGEAPTTVEKPFANVTIGVTNSVTEIAELADRKLTNDDGTIKQPAADGDGCDLYISTIPVLQFIVPFLQQGTIICFDDWFSYGGDQMKGEIRATREWLEKTPQVKLMHYRDFGISGRSFIVQMEKIK